MKLSDCITDYLRYLRYEQGVTASTLKTYGAALRRYLRWLETEGGYPAPGLEAFSTPVLRRFAYYLGGQGLRPRTIRGVFHGLIGLGQFLVTNGALSENPAKGVGMPKKDAAQRLTVTEEQVRLLFDACERQRSARKVAFSRAIIAVFVYGGLRRSECLDLKVDDLDTKEGSLLVRQGKGQKSRRVFLCEEGVTALREWLTQRPQNCRHDWLFALDANRRLHHDGLRHLVETLAAIAGMKGNEAVKPHTLRHFCATNLSRSGADIRSIQAFLGHSMLQTTALYLHADEERLRDIRELTALQPQKPKEDNVLHLPQRETARKRLRRIAHR